MSTSAFLWRRKRTDFEPLSTPVLMSTRTSPGSRAGHAAVVSAHLVSYHVVHSWCGISKESTSSTSRSRVLRSSPRSPEIKTRRAIVRHGLDRTPACTADAERLAKDESSRPISRLGGFFSVEIATHHRDRARRTRSATRGPRLRVQGWCTVRTKVPLYCLDSQNPSVDFVLATEG